MIKKRSGQKPYSNYNFCQIPIKKAANNEQNIKINSPELSHQENNYFYNTKINRLILQELPNNSLQNLYQQPTQLNKSQSIGNDLFQGKVNSLLYPKKINDNFLNKNSSFKILPIDMKKLKKNDNYYKQEINEDDYININNNSNNELCNNIFCNNDNDYLRDDDIVSTSLRLSDNPKRVIISKIIKNNNLIKEHKIPEISSKNKYYKIRQSNIKNKFKSPKSLLSKEKENNEFNNIFFQSGQGFYKKKNDININKSNNINKISRDKIVSKNGYVYYKNNPKNNRSIEITKRVNDNKSQIIHRKIKSYKIYDNKLLNKKFEKFCEIIEEVYFISFKSSYNYFMQNLKNFIKNRHKSRTLILRRFEDIQKSKHKKGSNSMIDIDVKNNDKYKTIIDNNIGQNIIEGYDNINKSHSPTKFTEINNKTNLTNSMIKINKDKYNEMLNNLLKNNNNNNNYRKIGQSQFDRVNTKNAAENIENNNIYNKYKTNTNINKLFQKNIYNKFNHKNVNNTELETKNKYINNNNLNENVYNELFSDQENYINKRRASNEQNNYQNLKANLKTRNNSCLDINNSNEKIQEQIKFSIDNNKTDLLYTKPIYKKSIDNSLNKETSIRISGNEKSKRINLKSNVFRNNNRSFDYEKKESNMNYADKKELIMKNEKTNDLRLCICIKYIPYENNIKKKRNKYFNNNILLVIQNDSFKINRKNFIKNKHESKYNKIFGTKSKNNKLISNRYSGYSDERNNNYFSQNFDKGNYNNDFNIDEKSKNIIQYLISLLQNIYNDNIKQVLFIFIKNLKKIKRNSIFSTMKQGNRNNCTRLIKKAKNNYYKENIFQTELSNVYRNDGNMNNKLYNNSQELSLNIKNKNIDYESKNLDTNNNKINDNKLNKDKNNKLNDDNKMENDKEKIEKKKLDKLGKLFNHLNKENNIINIIKEQFLDWTNKNDIRFDTNLNNDFEKSKKYNIKYLDKEYIHKDDSKNIENETEDKINKFRYNLS